MERLYEKSKKLFREVSEHVKALNDYDTQTYKDVKVKITKVQVDFQKTEKDTREEVTEIKKYFQQEAGSVNDKKTVLAKAREHGEKMKKYNETFNNYVVIVRNLPDEVQGRIDVLDKRQNIFCKYGPTMVLMGAVLVACLGGVTAWQVYNTTAVSYIAIGVAAGFSVGVLAFSMIFLGYLAQLKYRRTKWTGPEMVANISTVLEKEPEIKGKYAVTVNLNYLFGILTEDSISSVSKDIIKSCDKYLAWTDIQAIVK